MDCMHRTGDLITTTQDSLSAVRDDLDLVESELNRLPPSESDQVAALWDLFNDLRAHLDQAAAELPKLGLELARAAA